MLFATSYIPYLIENDYYYFLITDRNALRERYNEEYGTHYEPLDYDGDVQARLDAEFYYTVYPSQYEEHLQKVKDDPIRYGQYPPEMVYKTADIPK